VPDVPRGGPAQARRDVAELLAGATERAVLADVPGKSGARMERIVIDGRRYVLKHLDLATDWTMRALPATCAGRRSPCGNGGSWPGSRIASTSRSWP